MPASWNSVLIGMVWTPVSANHSRSGMVLKTCGGMSVGAFIAIVPGIADEAAAAVEQSEIHAPCVYGDALRGLRRCGGVFAEARLNLRPDAENVPVERAGGADAGIGEAVQFLHGKDAAVPFSQHDPSAGGAKVGGDEMGGLPHTSWIDPRRAKGQRYRADCKASARSAWPDLWGTMETLYSSANGLKCEREYIYDTPAGNLGLSDCYGFERFAGGSLPIPDRTSTFDRAVDPGQACAGGCRSRRPPNRQRRKHD